MESIEREGRENFQKTCSTKHECSNTHSDFSDFKRSLNTQNVDLAKWRALEDMSNNEFSTFAKNSKYLHRIQEEIPSNSGSLCLSTYDWARELNWYYVFDDEARQHLLHQRTLRQGVRVEACNIFVVIFVHFPLMQDISKHIGFSLGQRRLVAQHRFEDNLGKCYH